MHHEIIFAGFGGQGVLFAGQILALAATAAGKHVAWVPAYGPEMRGGTANVAVIISDEEIGSLVVSSPTAAVVMNPPSLEKYENTVKEGGILIVNSSMVAEPPKRSGIQIVSVAANDIAAELGNNQLANMVMLGAVIKATTAVTPDQAITALIGMVALLFASVFDYTLLRNMGRLMYLGTVASLLAVLLIGADRFGARRWFEIGGIAGLFLGAAARRKPALVDGLISSAGALIAQLLQPRSAHYMIASHLSVEQGHGPALAKLGKKPLLDLGLRLGEGTGAALAMPLVEAAARILTEVATFDEAGVSEKDG
jgi:2-oxoglutarate ferredoxin oxidoreductase subunit gamma